MLDVYESVASYIDSRLKQFYLWTAGGSVVYRVESQSTY
jgi:hypothetical protein